MQSIFSIFDAKKSAVKRAHPVRLSQTGHAFHVKRRFRKSTRYPQGVKNIGFTILDPYLNQTLHGRRE